MPNGLHLYEVFEDKEDFVLHAFREGKGVELKVEVPLLEWQVAATYCPPKMWRLRLGLWRGAFYEAGNLLVGKRAASGRLEGEKQKATPRGVALLRYDLVGCRWGAS